MQRLLFGIFFILNVFIFSLPGDAPAWMSQLDPTREVLKDHEVLQNLGSLPEHHKMNFYKLKVLVWNLLKGEREGLYKDLDILLADTDLVLTQENYLDKKFADLYTLRKDFDWKMAGSFRDNDGVITGVGTASIQKPLEYFFLRSPDTEPVIKTPKMMLASFYEIPGYSQKLLVLNIHGINFVGNDSFKRQIDQATKVIASHSGPVLYGGDFNTWNNTRMKYLNTALSKLGLAKIARPPSEGIGDLDHLYQRGFEMVSAKTYNSVNSSDHKPLYFELKLQM